MKISKILWSVVLVVAVIIVLDRVNKIFFIPKTSGDLQKKTPLIVGMMAGYAPFMTVNEDGDYEGFDVDVAKEFAKRMKREIRYKVMDLSELLFALDRKKIDLLVSGLTMTPERKKRIDMVHYHGGGQKTIPMAFWKEIPAGVKTLDDMAKMGLSVVVESGSSWEDCAGVVGLTKTKGFAHYPEMVLEIKHGKSDAVLFDPDIIGLYLSKFPEIKVVQLPLNGKFKIFGLGIGVHKSTPKLRDEVAEVVGQMREDGMLSRLESKWGLK